jgi:hypothetical protein
MLTVLQTKTDVNKKTCADIKLSSKMRMCNTENVNIVYKPFISLVWRLKKEIKIITTLIR